MSDKSKFIRDNEATVMIQTYEYLTNQSSELCLSIGEVIDRLVLNIKAPNSDFAAVWTCEQFALTSSDLDDEETEEAMYTTLVQFVLPLFQAGIKPDEVWFNVLNRVENFLRKQFDLGLN